MIGPSYAGKHYKQRSGCSPLMDFALLTQLYVLYDPLLPSSPAAPRIRNPLPHHDGGQISFREPPSIAVPAEAGTHRAAIGAPAHRTERSG